MAAVSQAFYTLTIVSPSERVVRNSHFYGLESSIKRCTKKAVIYSDVKLNWVLQQGITEEVPLTVNRITNVIHMKESLADGSFRYVSQEVKQMS